MAPLFPFPSPTFSPVSQFATAPSSPKLLPDDPRDSATLLCDTAPSFVPFDWEEKPGKPKSFSGVNDGEAILKFSLDRFDSFDGGKTRPLKPPPKLRNGASKLPPSPATTSSRRSRSWVVAVSDPFQAAIESARKNDGSLCEDDRRKTASFRQGRKATNPPHPGRVSVGQRGESLKGGAGYVSTGSSGSAARSNSRPGSGREPDDGCEVDRRSLTRHRKNMLSCFC